MTSVYDSFIGGRGGVANYVSGANETYPQSNIVDVLSTVYLPRIYGKDLSAFEIASSGKIAVTLSDIYSFDLERRSDSNVVFQGIGQDTVTFAADGSNYGLSFNPSSNQVALTSKGVLEIQTGSNVVFDIGDSLSITAASNITFESQNLDFVTDVFEMRGDDVVIVANSNIMMSSLSDSILLSSVIDLTLQSQRECSMTAGEWINATAGFGMNITTPNVAIDGNLGVSHVLYSTTGDGIQVQDKVINLAYTSNLGSNLVDGPDNDGAGVVVQGLPSGVDATSSNAYMYEKSITWNHNQGMEYIGTSNVSSESYWDVKGGSLRITHNKTNGHEVAFALRVNDHDELELVKKQWNTTSSNYDYKKIAKFGRTML